MADGYHDAKDKVLEDITTKGLEPNVVTWWVNCPIRMRLIPLVAQRLLMSGLVKLIVDQVAVYIVPVGLPRAGSVQ